MFLEIIKTLILGIIEGITEWLPISSTGHLILAEEFIKLNMTEEFMEMFDVVIQLGAILAVVVVFFDKLNPFSAKKNKSQKYDTYALWIKVIAACLPAAVIGLAFDNTIDKYLFNSTVVAVMLIFYGVIFIIIENRRQNKKPKYNTLESLPLTTAFIIGLFQVLALIPGTSRSGATIIGGLIIGCSRFVAAEFTFFLAIPVMFGASLLKIVKFGLHFTSAEVFILLVGMVSAFLVSVWAIKFLMAYVKNNSFKVFGWYRIALGIIVLAFFMIGAKAEIVNTYTENTETGIVKTYYEMSNDTWQCDNNNYKYRLELKGTLPNAAGESTYVVLTDNKKLTFEDAAYSIFGSNSEDAKAMEGSVIVEMK